MYSVNGGNPVFGIGANKDGQRRDKGNDSIVERMAPDRLSSLLGHQARVCAVRVRAVHVCAVHGKARVPLRARTLVKYECTCAV